MIKAKGRRPDGRAFVVLGLSHENLRRLKDDQPIVISGESLHLPDVDSIYIFAGETEQSMTRELHAHGIIGAETEVHLFGSPGGHTE
jgi:hypothetical protein